MMDDTTLAYLEKNKDDANPSYWIPKLVAEIRRLRVLAAETEAHERAATQEARKWWRDRGVVSRGEVCARLGLSESDLNTHWK